MSKDISNIRKVILPNNICSPKLTFDTVTVAVAFLLVFIVQRDGDAFGGRESMESASEADNSTSGFNSSHSSPQKEDPSPTEELVKVCNAYRFIHLISRSRSKACKRVVSWV